MTNDSQSTIERSFAGPTLFLVAVRLRKCAAAGVRTRWDAPIQRRQLGFPEWIRKGTPDRPVPLALLTSRWVRRDPTDRVRSLPSQRSTSRVYRGHRPARFAHAFVARRTMCSTSFALVEHGINETAAHRGERVAHRAIGHASNERLDCRPSFPARRQTRRAGYGDLDPTYRMSDAITVKCRKLLVSKWTPVSTDNAYSKLYLHLDHRQSPQLSADRADLPRHCTGSPRWTQRALSTPRSPIPPCARMSTEHFRPTIAAQ
jgi:hypothetical protein